MRVWPGIAFVSLVFAVLLWPRHADTPASSPISSKSSAASHVNNRQTASPWPDRAAEALALSDHTQLLLILTGWSQTNPRAAAEWTAAHLTPPELAPAIDEVLAQWADSDPPQAMQWLIDNNPHVGNEPYNTIISRWAASDIAQASLWLEQNPDYATLDASSSILREITRQQNEASAIQWFHEHVRAENKSDILPVLLTYLSEDETIQAALKELDRDAANVALAHASQALASTDDAAARKLVSLISDPAAQKEALRKLDIHMAHAAPAGIAVTPNAPGAEDAALALPEPPSN